MRAHMPLAPTWKTRPGTLQLDVFRPKLVSQEDMTKFHSDDYVHFLRNTTPDNMHEFLTQLQRFNVSRSRAVPSSTSRPRALF